MIYEFRTYTLTPGAMPKVLDMFAEAYEHRKKYSELVAFWRTEFGPLNQIIHVWPYESAQHREEVRAAAVEDPKWPPGFAQLGLVVDQRAEVFKTAPNSPFAEPGTYGPIYEVREYIIKPGSMPTFLQIWGDNVHIRTAFSPLAAALYSDVGGLNKFLHIWPYESMESRTEARNQASATGQWPPEGELRLIERQSSMLATPAPFSPLQ
ncbi:MAG: NIPSNAP family protein [Alphaproteobacteria bacterium]|nr:NIPSNAP family protein [Alphaproteobacteria bacterium]